jgi:hypothetical protein
MIKNIAIHNMIIHTVGYCTLDLLYIMCHTVPSKVLMTPSNIDIFQQSRIYAAKAGRWEERGLKLLIS